MEVKRLVIPLLVALPTGVLMAWAANYLRQHKEGINVDDVLNAICEELSKRSGIDFCGAEITGVVEPRKWSGFDDEMLMVAVPLLLFVGAIGAFLYARSRSFA